MKFYRAPWSRTLLILSLAITLFCFVFAFWPLSQAGVAGFIHATKFPYEGFRLMSLAVLAWAALVTVRGYTVTPDAILVHRLGWRSLRISRADVQSVQAQPGAMSHALRWFGIGGLYSFSGFYQNPQLGMFRAFVTDRERTVVIRTARRTYVVSPDDPESFVQTLSTPR